jgi:hypothetical protein
MAAGDVTEGIGLTEGIGHGQHGEAERQRDAEKADADLRKGRREHGASAAAEDQPERAQELGPQALMDFHAAFSTNGWRMPPYDER